MDGGEGVDRTKGLHGGELQSLPAAHRDRKAKGAFARVEGDYFKLLRVPQNEVRMLLPVSFRVLETEVWSVPTRVFITSP